MSRKKLTAVFFILVKSVTFSFGYDIQGTIQDISNNKPIENVNVIIVELDLIEITNKKGGFIFKNIKPGKYSMDIIVPGYKEKKLLITADRDMQLIIKLEPIIVEMQKIRIVAEKTKKETSTVNIYSKDEIEKIPTGGDPYNPINMEPGVITNGTVIEDSSAVIHNELPASNFYPFYDTNLRFTVLGGESDWNNFYYDYIKLPYSFHAFGIPFPRSVIPEQLSYTLFTYKGINPVTKGSGIGGLFVIEPSSKVPMANKFVITPSLSYLDMYTESRFSENTGLILSLRKSIFEYTYFPIFRLDYMIDNSTYAGNGDVLLRLFIGNNNNRIVFDLLGFYDLFGQDIKVQPEGSIESILYFISTGVKWDLSFTNSLKNKMYIYFSSSLQMKTDKNWDDVKQATVLSKKIKINLNSIVGADELNYQITDLISSVTGIKLKYDILSANYNTKTVKNIEEISIFDTDKDEWVWINGDLKSYGQDYQDMLWLLIFDPYFYSRLMVKISKVDLIFGSGLSWLPLQNIWRFSLEAESDITLSDNIIGGLRLGCSPSSINEIAYMQGKLNEKILNLKNITSLSESPISASSILFFKWLPNDISTINLQPYFVWYYNLSGFIYQTSYKTTLGFSGEPIFPDTEKGYSTGVDIRWEYIPGARFRNYITYSLSWTKYLVKDIGWISANTDVRHTFKNFISFEPVKNLLVSSNLFIFFDKPFTPYKVTDTDGDGIGDSFIPEKLNSARDLIPRFRLDFQMKWNFKLFNGNGSLFINTANLLAFINPILKGIKKDKETMIGASTRYFENRNYQFQGKQNNLLQSEIGISITF